MSSPAHRGAALTASKVDRGRLTTPISRDVTDKLSGEDTDVSASADPALTQTPDTTSAAPAFMSSFRHESCSRPRRLYSWRETVRLKITRRLSGSIDGLQLAHFEPGEVYDVGTSLGCYLLAVGAAEPVREQRRAEGSVRSERPQAWSTIAPTPSTAADTPSSRKR
jgi:hypothetical protein